MSLDVSLVAREFKTCEVWVRRDQDVVRVTQEEWQKISPAGVPLVASELVVYDANITHNLGVMAKQADLYRCLWCPEALEIHTARHLAVFLRAGLERLKAAPEMYKQYNPRNGWGNYENLVEFVTKYLAACEAHPDAYIHVSG